MFITGEHLAPRVNEPRGDLGAADIDPNVKGLVGHKDIIASAATRVSIEQACLFFGTQACRAAARSSLSSVRESARTKKTTAEDLSCQTKHSLICQACNRICKKGS